MKSTKLKMSFLFILVQTVVFGNDLFKNDSIVKPQVRFSPTQIANLKTTENHYVKCTYGQPMKKGRTIFGNIVPFGKLWRTGANETTEITFTCNVKIGEKQLAAGTYSLFTIPNKENWTIILNSVLGQWGDFTYDSTKNVLNYQAIPQKNDNIYEGFTIAFEDKSNAFDMFLLWDDVKITIPIQVIGEIVEPKSKKKKKSKK